MNLQVLVGNVGQIGELMGKDSNVLEFSVATDDRWKNGNGEWETETEWHIIKIFGNKAKIIYGLIKKGDIVSVEGKTKTEKLYQKDGSYMIRKVVYSSKVKKNQQT